MDYDEDPEFPCKSCVGWSVHAARQKNIIEEQARRIEELEKSVRRNSHGALVSYMAEQEAQIDQQARRIADLEQALRDEREACAALADSTVGLAPFEPETATGSGLDYLASVYGVRERAPGETDAELRARMWSVFDI